MTFGAGRWRVVAMLGAVTFWIYGIGAAAAEPTAVAGLWAGPRSIIEVAVQGDTLSARVLALKDPNYLQGEEFGPIGAPRRDDRNPDEALRSRPLIGLELLHDYRYEDGKWQGRIYDPESGNTYSSNLRVADGQLQMRGYVGVPWLGRTATFVPAASCAAPVREMLQRAALDSVACD